MQGAQAKPAHIRLVWKWLNVTNTLAYYCIEIIIAVKRFIVQAPGYTMMTLKIKEKYRQSIIGLNNSLQMGPDYLLL